MTAKRNPPAQEATQVFRQFAWHLAGSLAAAGKAEAPAARPRPGKAAARR